ncbi:MAG: aldehyde dehydrogenase family protein [Candidatus Wukongarchaeota archaeon]|nr:aldehyde dehydrogenase family protein [Candidatus Wukongarchaeota archaeon]
MNESKTYKNYIGGKWVESATGTTFNSINPANKEEILVKLQKSDEKDGDMAVDAAEDAFEKWSSMPAPKRGEILFKAARILEEQKEELAKTMTKEMGKILIETRGDVQEAIDIIKLMAGEGRRLYGHTTPSELPNKFCMTINLPVGIVALITPWNFPMAIPAWKIAPALIAGNTIVFKPASDTPLCAIKLVEIFEKAGIPKGVLNIVTGSGTSVGMPLVKHKKIRGISFTGSVETGQIITKEAGLKRVGLELGGKNVIIVMDDANIDLAVDGAIWGGFGTTGQRCTAASRVVVHEKVGDKFTEKFVERAKKLKVGDGLDPETEMGPAINESQLKKIHKYTEIGKEEGATLLTGGKILTEGKFTQGFFYEPTIFSDVTKDMTIAQDEIFGPTVAIMAAENLEEAIHIANSVEYGLSSSIYTESINNAFKAIEKIEAGLTYVNSSTIGSEVHLPFGGVKNTGNGTREGGIKGIEEFVETKTAYIDYSGRLQRAQIDIE